MLNRHPEIEAWELLRRQLSPSSIKPSTTSASSRTFLGTNDITNTTLGVRLMAHDLKLTQLIRERKYHNSWHGRYAVIALRSVASKKLEQKIKKVTHKLFFVVFIKISQKFNQKSYSQSFFYVFY